MDDSLCDEGTTAAAVAALLPTDVAAGCWGVSQGRAAAGCGCGMLALSRLLVGWPCSCVRGGAC